MRGRDQAARSPRFKGYEKMTFSLRPEQAAALRTAALRRAGAVGSIRPDAGALVREALDAWLTKNAKR